MILCYIIQSLYSLQYSATNTITLFFTIICYKYNRSILYNNLLQIQSLQNMSEHTLSRRWSHAGHSQACHITDVSLLGTPESNSVVEEQNVVGPDVLCCHHKHNGNATNVSMHKPHVDSGEVSGRGDTRVLDF
jgi:hypothetical protein